MKLKHQEKNVHQGQLQRQKKKKKKKKQVKKKGIKVNIPSIEKAVSNAPAKETKGNIQLKTDLEMKLL